MSLLLLGVFPVFRNLSLGAKAETAYGKNIKLLSNDTKVQLIKLLNGTASQSMGQQV